MNIYTYKYVDKMILLTWLLYCSLHNGSTMRANLKYCFDHKECVSHKKKVVFFVRELQETILFFPTSRLDQVFVLSFYRTRVPEKKNGHTIIQEFLTGGYVQKEMNAR